MKVLVTGAKGFVGKNLCAQLKNIKDGKARCYGDLTIEAVYEYDIDSTAEELDTYCRDCDFVFNLAGVIQSGRRKPAERAERVYGRKLRLCFYLAGYIEETRKYLPGDAFFIYSGYLGRPFRYFRIWKEQESWGGTVLHLWPGDRSQGIGVSLPESVREMVSPQL